MRAISDGNYACGECGKAHENEVPYILCHECFLEFHALRRELEEAERLLEESTTELEESIMNEGMLHSFKAVSEKCRSFLARRKENKA